MRMRGVPFSVVVLLLTLSLTADGARGAAPDSVSLWDTGKHSDQGLPPDAVAKRDGWKEVADAKAGLAGDACLVNDYLALVLRLGSPGAEWYYRLGDSWVKGPVLVPVGAGGDKAKAIESLKATEKGPNGVGVEASFTTESGKKVISRYLVKGNNPIVETQPSDGTEKLRVEAQGRHAVIPDLYGGDFVITAQDVQSPQIPFPSENMVLQLADNGNAIVMCVWRSRDQQVNMSLDGTGENRAISATEIAYKKGEGFYVWVAVMAAPKIWHQQKISELHPVKDRQLDWKLPFCAEWRADYRRADGLIDSWPLLVKKENGEFEKPTGKYEGFRLWLKNRTVTSTARGHHPYVGYVENDTAYLRNSKFEGRSDIVYKPEGCVVLYPLQRIGKSPAGVFGALEVLGEALKDTPEAKLAEDLPVKRPERDKYPTTCSTTKMYEEIFDAHEEKAKKEELLKCLEANDRFVEVIRSRIVEYMDWAKDARAFCAKEKAEKPQVAALADEFDAIIGKIQARYDRAKLAERTPQAAQTFNQKVRELIDSNEDNKADKAKELGRQTRTVGGSQDQSIGDFRISTKELRQRAGYRMTDAKDDVTFGFAKEMRDRTAKILSTAFQQDEHPLKN